MNLRSFSSDFYSGINGCVYLGTTDKVVEVLSLSLFAQSDCWQTFLGLLWFVFCPLNSVGISFFPASQRRSVSSWMDGGERWHSRRVTVVWAHVADTTDPGHLAAWREVWKFGKVPRLCEYHHLPTFGFIRISLERQSVASVGNTASPTWCVSGKY